LVTHGAKVPGTDGQKMSKSYGNTIDIFAEGKALKTQVMGIVTDSTPVEAPKDPAKSVVYALYSLFSTPEEREEMASKYLARRFGYGDQKKMLLAKIDAHFAPSREKRKELAKTPAAVEDILLTGGRRARAVAQETLALVRQATGFNPRPVS